MEGGGHDNLRIGSGRIKYLYSFHNSERFFALLCIALRGCLDYVRKCSASDIASVESHVAERTRVGEGATLVSFSTNRHGHCCLQATVSNHLRERTCCITTRNHVALRRPKPRRPHPLHLRQSRPPARLVAERARQRDHQDPPAGPHGLRRPTPQGQDCAVQAPGHDLFFVDY